MRMINTVPPISSNTLIVRWHLRAPADIVHRPTVHSQASIAFNVSLSEATTVTEWKICTNSTNSMPSVTLCKMRRNVSVYLGCTFYHHFSLIEWELSLHIPYHVINDMESTEAEFLRKISWSILCNSNIQAFAFACISRFCLRLRAVIRENSVALFIALLWQQVVNGSLLWIFNLWTISFSTPIHEYTRMHPCNYS